MGEMPRRLALLPALVLIVAACAYESSGTTTTTVVDAAEIPPSTGPADVVLEDQRIEGTVMTVASVTMPDAGWVVVRVDQGGGPGEIIGISEILRKGVIARVPIPFFVPITGDTVVYATVHIDMDRDGEFTYAAPDLLIDEIATLANGQAASASATIELLPPIQPGEATLEPQRTDGTRVVGAAAVLPAPGFVTLMSNVLGEPGEVLDVTDLFAAGTLADVELFPEPPLRVSGLVFLVVWVDRDEDGLFDPELDDIAVRTDGSLAASGADITVVPLEPASITVDDQSGDGSVVLVSGLELPGPGFVELLADDNGQPGERLGVSGALVAGTQTDFEFELEDSLSGTATTEVSLWIRIIIDFDEDGAVTDADPYALEGPAGAIAQERFLFTFE